MIHHKNVLIIMNDIPVTHVHCWTSVHRSRRRFWSRVWGLDKAQLKVDYLGDIPVESGAVVGDVLQDSHGQLFAVVLKGKVRNVHQYTNEFHLPNSLTVKYSTYAEETKS